MKVKYVFFTAKLIYATEAFGFGFVDYSLEFWCIW
jgi:hypothetical protein